MSVLQDAVFLLYSEPHLLRSAASWMSRSAHFSSRGLGSVSLSFPSLPLGVVVARYRCECEGLTGTSARAKGTPGDLEMPHQVCGNLNKRFP